METPNGGGFHEDACNGDGRRPGLADPIPFDWDRLYRQLGEAGEDVGEEQREQLAHALGDVIAWLCEPAKFQRGRSAQRAILYRVVALAWVVRPESLGARSLTKLAARIGVYKQRLGASSARIARKWGVRASGAKSRL